MKLELYHFGSCPYCAKVRKYIDAHQLNSKITYLDIREDQAAHDALVKMTGDYQVPCLVIDGKPMLESEDILDWMRENLK